MRIGNLCWRPPCRTGAGVGRGRYGIVFSTRGNRSQRIELEHPTTTQAASVELGLLQPDSEPRFVQMSFRWFKPSNVHTITHAMLTLTLTHVMLPLQVLHGARQGAVQSKGGVKSQLQGGQELPLAELMISLLDWKCPAFSDRSK